MLTLKVDKRDIFGKKLAAARLAGRLPAVVYGRRQTPIHIFVPAEKFQKILSVVGESTIISLDLSGEKKEVLIHEVALHPVSGRFLHVDFYAVDKTQEIEVGVSLRFVGAAPAVKELGGILVKVLHELEIKALPVDIPREIRVNLSLLSGLESQILVRDLKLPAGVFVLNDPEEVVAAVKEEKPEEAPPLDLSAIEVAKKGKKKETGAEVET